MKHLLFFVAAAALLSGCAMIGGKPAPASEPTATARPTGPIDLGEYAKNSEGAISSMFAKQIVARYAAGSPIGAAVKDLADNRFACAAPKAGGGDPPDQVCRRTLRADGCTYDYQVHLFDDPGKRGLNRVRGLYHKACGEELLGAR